MIRSTSPRDEELACVMKTLLQSLPHTAPFRVSVGQHGTIFTDTGHGAHLLDALPVMAIYLDADLRYRYVNQKYTETYGLSVEKLLGRHVGEVLHPDSFASAQPLLARALKGETIRHMPTLQIGGLGLRHVNLTIVPQRGTQGDVIGMHVVMLDKTEAVEAKTAAQHVDERFRMFSETIHDHLYEWNVVANTLWCTHSEMYGPIPERDSFEWWTAKIHPSDRALAASAVREAIATGSGWQSAYRVLSNEGRYVHVIDRAIIVRDESGVAVRAVGAVTDATARHQAEALLSEQKRILERANQGAPLQELLDMVATSIEELAQEPVHALISLQENGQLRVQSAPTLPLTFSSTVGDLPIGPLNRSCGRAAWFKKSVVVNDIATSPLFEACKDPLLAWGLHACLSVPIVDSNDAVQAVLCVLYPRAQADSIDDLNTAEMLAHTAGLAIERTRSAGALRRQSELTQTITENAAAGLFLLDESGRSTYLNRAASAITGFRAQSIVAKPVHRTLHGACTDKTCALARAVVLGERLRDFETTLHRRNGTAFQARCHYTPLRDRGEVTGGVLEIHDQTDLLTARALAETNRQLNEMHRLKSEFVSTMSHELRTPLNAIIGFTEVLMSEMSGPLSEVQHRQLRLVSDAGNDLLKLISDILELSRVEAGKALVESRPFDLAKCTQMCIECVRLDADKKGLSVMPLQLNTPCELTSDEQRVRQIILNLLSNAVKFTKDGGVVVWLEEQPDIVLLHVRDSGPGIDTSRVPDLFQAFSRAGTDPKNEGAGLGLHISRKLAGVLGGTLELASEVGTGTTLTLTLPRVSPVPED